jgi:hypothetical protein
MGKLSVRLMSLAEEQTRNPLARILDEVALALGRYGVPEGEGGRGSVRVELLRDVKRVVQVYWTPFQLQIEGECVGLFVEVKDPRPHWTEAYMSPSQRSWVFSFYEREDGEVQLAYHEEYARPADAVDGFFKLSAWYVLTATDSEWKDVGYTIDPALDWGNSRTVLAGTSASAAAQESLKKSTIMWLRWRQNGVERTMPVWYLLDNKSGMIYVISGERNQVIPGAAQMRECEVILRQKGKNIQVAELPASVRVVPLGPEWDEIAERIAEKRLNIPGLPEDTAKRWRDECVILEIRLRA